MALDDKTIVVTGGFGALGRVVAEEAMARGARVVLVGHGKAPDDLPAAGPHPPLVLAGVDLTDPAAAQAAMDHAAAQTGGIDALLNIAGGFRWQTVEKGELAAWDQLYARNLKTAVVACRAALPHLRASRAGRIVNIGAASAVKAGAGMGAYAAAKAGVAKLTESLAEELKDTAVTVNAVLPSIIDTAANRADMPKADVSRWVAPADLAAVILFLADDAARAVTGALIPVTGRV
jgi:NAD(P)-dependent dehydrogenase (short-subunit alcohol dehydrogenase family)